MHVSTGMHPSSAPVSCCAVAPRRLSLRLQLPGRHPLRDEPLPHAPLLPAGRCRVRGVLRVKSAAEPKQRAADAAPAAPPAPGKKFHGKGEEQNKGVPQPPSSPPPLPPPPRRSRPLYQKLADQLVDTVEDISRHAGRAIAPLPTRSALDEGLRGGGGGRIKLGKPVVMVLGSGWGAHSLIKVIDTDIYDVVLVSPRNYFFFTPMLPSCAVGTVEFRSLTDPVRTANPFVNYLDARCTKVDFERKLAFCEAVTGPERCAVCFELQYDTLVVAIGEQPSTFGVAGVREHCFFLKEINDAINLRQRVGENFEFAALPSTTAADRARALHFVVVGGGPTGVEFAGTLADFLRQDLRKKYPELMPLVRVTMLQSAQSILTMFDADLQANSLKQLRSSGIDVRLGVKVVEVTASRVVLANGEQLEYGLCVWSAGNSARELTQDMIKNVPAQAAASAGVNPAAQKLLVDDFLRVVGAEGVLALGDCSAMVNGRLPATAQVAAQQGAYLAHLINRGYAVGFGGLDMPPPSKQVPLNALQKALVMLSPGKKEFESGTTSHYDRAFDFLDLGMMAYVGGDRAATDMRLGDPRYKATMFGYGAYALWRSVYITKQVSLRNRVLILFDWVKTKFFGRDVSLF